MPTYSNLFGGRPIPPFRSSMFNVQYCPARSLPSVTSVCSCSTPVPRCGVRLRASDLRLLSFILRLSGFIRPYPDRNCFRGGSPCLPNTKMTKRTHFENLNSPATTIVYVKSVPDRR
jgi:hypothetical protein